MDGIGSIFNNITGWKWFSVAMVLQAFALYYSWLIYIYFPKHKITYNTSLMVSAGVLITIIGHGLIIGWNTTINGYESIIVLFVCFFITGWPMIGGYSMRESMISKAAEKRAYERLNKHNTNHKNNHNHYSVEENDA